MHLTSVPNIESFIFSTFYEIESTIYKSKGVYQSLAKFIINISYNNYIDITETYQDHHEKNTSRSIIND